MEADVQPSVPPTDHRRAIGSGVCLLEPESAQPLKGAKVYACENFGLSEQRDASEDTRAQRPVWLVDCREPVGLVVIWIHDRTAAPLITASRFQPPNDRPAALRRALGWIVEPDNPTAD